jgi:hypothetical protein
LGTLPAVLAVVAVLAVALLGQSSTSLNTVANAYISAHNGDLSAYTWTTVPGGFDAAFSTTYGGQAYVCHFPVDSSGQLGARDARGMREAVNDPRLVPKLSRLPA